MFNYIKNHKWDFANSVFCLCLIIGLCVLYYYVFAEKAPYALRSSSPVVKGDKGDKGDIGTPGTAGINGTNGTNGTPGTPGTSISRSYISANQSTLDISIQLNLNEYMPVFSGSERFPTTVREGFEATGGFIAYKGESTGIFLVSFHGVVISGNTGRVFLQIKKDNLEIGGGSQFVDFGSNPIWLPFGNTFLVSMDKYQYLQLYAFSSDASHYLVFRNLSITAIQIA